MFPIFSDENFTQVIHINTSFLDIDEIQVGDIVHCVVGTKESPQEDGDIVALYDVFPCVVLEKHPQAIFVDSPGQILTVAQATFKPSAFDERLLVFKSTKDLHQKTEELGVFRWSEDFKSEYQGRVAQVEEKVRALPKPKYKIGDVITVENRDGKKCNFGVEAIRISATSPNPEEARLKYKIHSAGTVPEIYYILEPGVDPEQALENLKKEYKYPDYLWVEG